MVKTYWVHIEPDNQLIEDTDFLRKQMKEFPGRYKHLIEVLKKSDLIEEFIKEEHFGSLTAEDQLIILVIFEKFGIDLLKEFDKIGVSYG